MKFKIAIIAAFLAALAAGVFLFRSRVFQFPFVVRIASLPKGLPSREQFLSIQGESVKEGSATSTYTIDANYPQLHGVTNGTAQEGVNAMLRKITADEVSSFKGEVANIQPQSQAVTRQEGIPSTLEIGYDAATLSNDIVSVQMTISTYIVGAAHPNTHTRTVSYDLKNGKPIQLSDLFVSGSNYLVVLSRLAAADLTAQIAGAAGAAIPLDQNQIAQGTAPTADNFKSFVLKRDSLILIFDPYQVGPYAAGILQVSIPYSKLSSVLDPVGPVRLL